jgi:putative endonuclease
MAEVKYFVYAIRSDKDGSIYVGMTGNIEKRFIEHNRGNVFSTKGHRPYRLIYKEECRNRILARNREKYWKSGIGKEKLKLLTIIAPA